MYSGNKGISESPTYSLHTNLTTFYYHTIIATSTTFPAVLRLATFSDVSSPENALTYILAHLH